MFTKLLIIIVVSITEHIGWACESASKNRKVIMSRIKLTPVCSEQKCTCITYVQWDHHIIKDSLGPCICPLYIEVVFSLEVQNVL